MREVYQVLEPVFVDVQRLRLVLGGHHFAQSGACKQMLAGRRWALAEDLLPAQSEWSLSPQQQKERRKFTVRS